MARRRELLRGLTALAIAGFTQHLPTQCWSLLAKGLASLFASCIVTYVSPQDVARGRRASSAEKATSLFADQRYDLLSHGGLVALLGFEITGLKVLDELTERSIEWQEAAMRHLWRASSRNEQRYTYLLPE